MEREEWNYKLQPDMFSFVPLAAGLLIFGGVSLWLYRSGNGAVLFTGILTAAMLGLTLYNLYRALFVRLLIGKYGFYFRTRPGRGTYYQYADIAEAWESSAKGAASYYLNFRPAGGPVVKFAFQAYQSDGIDYLLEQVNGGKGGPDESGGLGL